MFVLLVESCYLWIAISETVETWVHEENVLTTDRLVLKRSTYLAHASRYRWAAERTRRTLVHRLETDFTVSPARPEKY